MPISIKGNGYVNPTITVHPVTPQNTITVNSSTPESQEINTNPLYGPTGNGISNIEKTSTSGVTDTYTIYFTNGTTTAFTVTNGTKGDTGNGIASVVLNDDYTLTLTYTDGTTYTTSSIRGETGETGETGNGIVSIEKTDTTGLVDTYTITYTNGDTDTFTITNGADGQDGEDGQDGADGYSPTATVSKSGNTATITITDKNGTTTETITDGADGQDGQNGQDGADGYSPTATVTKSGSVATITITDKNGTTSTTISDGVGAVSSVNGMSGDVTLTASDVGALPDSTVVPTINTTNNYVPYRSGASSFANSTLMYNSSAMAFTGKLNVGSSSPSSYSDKGRFTIYDNTPSSQVTSMALLNYGGGGGCGVAIDMYNTSANGGIPSGRFGVVDNGNYSGYLQLKVKKSGAASNPLLPAMNIVPVPASNSLTTCVSFGQDEFNRVLFDLHKPEATVTITDSDKRWGGSGTTYQVTGSNKFNSRLLVAVGDIVSFDSFTTEATVTGVVSNSSTCQITVNQTLGTISNKNISVKKAYFKITDENNNTKVYVDPYGKFGIGTGTPAYELDVAGTINANALKVNGQDISVDTDDITISKNTDDELQSIGVIDNNSGNALKTWTGTKAQYDAIATKDANTLYNITDDTDTTLSLLELLYPVGAIYIGTMLTCPLATLGVGTWQLVASDRVLQGAGTRGSVGTTVNESLPNIIGDFSTTFINGGDTTYSNSFRSGTGAFKKGNSYTASAINSAGTASSTQYYVDFDASLSSSTYQNNAPVQQDAYLVNIWERVA